MTKQPKGQPVTLFAAPGATLEVAAPAAGQPRWTPAQLRGITTTGHSLLVSAAAGSGKTAVLAERCAHLVCDADDPCDVDELLVVTFTEAAAAEMRSRIGAALRGRAASVPGGPSERLSRQLTLLDRASVSTLHGFCSRLLRQHFHLVGLDPGFAVLDGDEAKLLRAETCRQLFEDRYELDESGAFRRFVDAYVDGDDERLVGRVIHVHEMLCSLVDPDGWINRSLERIRRAGEGGLGESDLGRELVEYLSTGLLAMRARCDGAIVQVAALGGFSKYVDVLRGHAATLETWDRRLREGGVDALAEEVAGIAFASLPRFGKDVPGKDVAKAAVDGVREAMKEGPWRDCLRFTAAQWRDGLKRVMPHAEVFLGLVRQFGDFYRMRKDASRSIDFSDLERFALRALRDPNQPAGLAPSAAARAQHRRFRHVLVDEYQDINEVQDAILCLLSRECVRGEPGVETNLFCVGDVKQSIYRFRLAEPTRFLDRQRQFRSGAASPGEVIDLQSNFRSRGPLLEAVNHVFERLMNEDAVDLTYDQSHRLVPGKEFPAAGNGVCCFEGAPIELHLLPDKLAATGDPADAPADDAACDGEDDLGRAEREALLVARRIRELMGLDGGTPTCVIDTGPDGVTRPRPMRFGDVVVLLRSMKHKADEYAEVLAAAGIPVHSDSSSGYFESTEVRDLLALLAVLDNRRQDVPLAALLRSPLARLPEPEDSLASVRIAYPPDKAAFHEAVTRYAAEQTDDLAAWLRAFFDRVSRWRDLARRRPLSDLIWTLYHDTGYLAYCGGLRNGRQRVANLLYLHERAAQFSSFNRQGLSRFLSFLESLREESDLGQPQVATAADDVVRVMSVHRSKGLEFPVVVLPDLGKSINLQDCRGVLLADRKAGLGMPVVDEHKRVRYPSLASMLVQNRLRQQALAEEMRVLYVAMTRAKEHLILIGTVRAGTPAKWESRWRGHHGRLPADVVLAAGSMLDWIGPVAAATAPPRGDVFRVRSYAAEDVQAWEHPSRQFAGWSESQDRMARLEPLIPPAPADPLAKEVIRRLTAGYAYAPYTHVPGAAAVTARSAPSSGRAGPVRAIGLAPAAVSQSDRPPTAMEIGSATHTVLQHLDFSRPCHGADVAAQIEELVGRRLVDARSARGVDLDALAWAASSEIGTLFRRNAKALRREVPVYAALHPVDPVGRPLPGTPDPLDRVMVRGRLDVLLPLNDRCVIVDYKTDAISADRVDERVELYRPQLAAYADSIAAMTGKPVRTLVVFLGPRVIREV